MKPYLLLITLLMLMGCETDQSSRNNGEKTNHELGSTEEVTIDSCEYIIYDGFESGGIIHKGNCNNEIHQR